MITYFYDGKEYHQGKMEFNNFGGCASVNIGNYWLSCNYSNYKHKDEKFLRDNLEERLKSMRRMKR